MAHYAQPDDPWFTHQPAYIGLNWDTCGEELSQRDDVRYILTDPALVQIEDWEDRFHANFAHIFVVGRMRASDDARLPRIEFLQFYSNCLLRSRYLRYCRDADLRRFRRCHPLL